MLWALLALPSWHAGATDSTLGRVEVQGESAVAREKKTLAQLFKAEALFEKHRALAPLATLKFKVYARTQADTAPSLDLGLMAPGGRQSLQLDAQDRFVIDPAWRQLDDATEVRSRLADGRVTWRPDIRTPGLPEGERRLGDLRLQCRVAFNSGVARGGLVFGFLPSLSDGCGHAAWSSSNFADQPVFAVTLVHGERRLTLSGRLLHGLRDRDGERFDWGYSLRERMFRLPMGDAQWPDDTRVLFESMDDPPSPQEESLLASGDPWTRPALSPGMSPADVTALLGPAVDDLRFESGRRVQRRMHEVKTPEGRLALEWVSLFDADDRLVKSQLRRDQGPMFNRP